MKCVECGAEMTTHRENYKYGACGLPGVTLVGVDVSRCRDCGEVEVAIPNIEGLHRVLAQEVARKRERLTPAEIRYLRKWLGLSGVDFAAHVGVTAETVSRWEQGATAMGGSAERLLRWFVFTREPVSEYPLNMLKDVAIAQPRPIKVGLRVEHGHWQAAMETRALAGIS
jgi:putative zinc finger/helix-turn-helix YgiT family protein